MMRLVFAQPLSAEMPKGNLPKRIKVLGWGANVNANGKPVVVGELLAQAYRLPMYAWRRVPLDFEHNTVPGTPAYLESREPREVAGYGTVDIVPGDGVYLAMSAWTPKGEETAHNYACVSATPFINPKASADKDGNVLGITSVALCRNGAVPGMDFVDVPLAAFLPVNGQTETHKMDYKEKLCALLGLDASATDEDITAAIDAAKSKKPDPAPDPAPEQQPLSADVLAAAITKAVAPLSAQVAGFTEELAKRDRQAILNLAKAQGKVVALSASVLGKMTAEELTEHVKGLAVTVPLSARTPEGLTEVPLAAGPTEAQKAIARNMGVDPETVWPAQK